MLITYKITSDVNSRLKNNVRVACNFWNRFVKPSSPIVIRLGTFTSFGTTIARAYQPYGWKDTIYNVIEFNTNYLEGYSDSQVAGTLVHEIGHALGFGWDKWMKLFDQQNGKFSDSSISTLPSLARMLVETDYGPGTVLSHWDESKFGGELMTGIKDNVEYVLSVTIDVISLLGHTVLERLKKRTMLDRLLADAKQVQFSNQQQAKLLDLDFYKETPVWEELYNFNRHKKLLT